MTAWWNLPLEPDAAHAARLLADIEAHTSLWTVIVNYTPRAADQFRTEIAAWTGEQRRLAALALHHHSCGEVSPADPMFGALRLLGECDAPWTKQDLVWCLDIAARSRYESTNHLELPAAIVARLDPAEWTDLRPLLRTVFAHVVGHQRFAIEGKRRVTATLGRALDRGSGGIPHSLLHASDGFGRLARATLDDELTSPGVAAMLLHCGTLERPAPSKAWQRTLDELLAQAPNGPAAARAVLGLYADHRSYVHDDIDRLIRGLIWTVG